MIKINLLPTKKKPPKKVLDLQQQVLLAVLVLVLVLIGMGYSWKRQSGRINHLEREKVVVGKRVAEQDALLKDVKSIEEERKKVAEKIEIIAKLKENQAGPVLLLDEVSSALPKGVAVVSLSENNNVINIDGEAFTNENVVRFIENLKASRRLANVMLLETSQATRDGADIYKYRLQFSYKGL